MLRRVCGACIALMAIAVAIGCSEAADPAITSGTAALAPPGQVSPPPPTETAAPTELPDFMLPTGDAPGWLRYDNPSGPPLIRFSPDSKLLAAAYGGSIHFWDVTTGRQTRALNFTTRQSEIGDFEFSPDGTWLAVVDSGRIDIWDVAAGTFRSLTAEKFGPYSQVDISPDGSRLALGPVFAPPAETYNAEIWDTKTWTRQRVLVDAYGFSFSPDGSMLAAQSGLAITRSSYHPGPPVLFDVTTGARRALAVEGFPTSLEYSPDGKLLAINTLPLHAESGSGEVSGQAGTLLVDPDSGEIQRFIPSPDSGVANARFNADGSLLVATYTIRNRIFLWDARSGTQAFALNSPAKWVTNFAFSPDGRLLAAVSSEERRILFWTMPQ